MGEELSVLGRQAPFGGITYRIFRTFGNGGFF